MNFTKSIGLAWLIAAGGVTIVSGAESRTDINPALLYYQAVQVAPDLTAAERDLLFTREWRGQPLPARFGELVTRYDNQFELVRQAAKSTVPCDWGIDWSKGPETLLPHLGRNKAVAQAARLRAMWFLQNGRSAEAVTDLLAAFALSRNCSQDGSLIAALVQIAGENIFCSTVAENFHQFSPEMLQRLVEGFATAPPRRSVADCIPVERLSFPNWMINKVQALQKANPGNDAQVLERVREAFSTMSGGGDGVPPDATLWPRILSAAGGTSDGIIRLVHEEESLYPRLASILALPAAQYEEPMVRFTEEARKSPNPIITELFPAWQKAPPKEFAILTELAMVRAAVEYKLHGEAGLKSVNDPCGNGPFAVQRFVFEGQDRGFQLAGAYAGRGFQEVMIFVEKDGPPFNVNGKTAGQPPSK